MNTVAVCYNSVMKRVLVILALLLPSLAWAEPAIVFQTEQHDFGEVVQGTQLEYAFEFMNSGPDELIIKEVDTS